MLADDEETPDLHFTAPIPPILLLDFAAECRRAADSGRTKLRGSMGWRSDNSWGFPPKFAPVVFDTIANELGAITFSWMALEAFANFALSAVASKEFSYERLMKGGGTKSCSARKAEADIPVMEKVTAVLPQIFTAVGSLPEDLGAELDALRDLRRRTEHLKAADHYNTENLKAGPMGLALVGRVCAPQIVCRIVRHFGEAWMVPELAAKVSALDTAGLRAPEQGPKKAR